MATLTRSLARPRRTLAGLALVALVAASACGDTTENAAAPTEPSEPTLPLIRVAPGGGDGRLASTEAMASDAAVDMMWIPQEFVLVGELPTLDGSAGGWYYAPRADLDPEAAARVVAALGLSGEPEPLPADWGMGWRLGPDDGSAPSVWFGADGMQTWWYQQAWDDQSRWGVVCEDVEARSGADPEPGTAVPTTTIVDELPEGCVDLGPPEGVFTEAEARDAAVALLGALGIDADRYDVEAYADEWSAWVTVFELLDGVRSGMVWNMSFGANGALTYASGHLAAPEAAGPFPRVGTAEGFRRLQDGGESWWWGGARAFAEPAEADAPTIEPGPLGVDADDPDIELWQPEPVVVEIVDVRDELWQIWDADGSVWLVPAYAFLDADGNSYLVPAIPDDLVEVVEPVPTDEPVDPDTPVTDTGTSGTGTPDDPDTTEREAPMTSPIDDDAAALIGMTEDEARVAAAAQGWVVRVAVIDGEPLALTMDYREDRINVTLVDGVVTAAYVG